MDEQETEQTLCAAIKELFETVQELLEKPRIFPALILVYSGVDILGSLLRPKANPDTTGEDFKRWIDRYLFPESSLHCSSNDLWGARCGLLHTDTPTSRLSRRGDAREICYVRGEIGLASFVNKEFQKQDPPKVFLDVDQLFNALLAGVQRFLNDIQADPLVRETVFHHAKALFSHCRFTLG